MRSYQDKVSDIVANADRHHRAFYAADRFRGPSLYFHRRALETGHAPGDLTHLEFVYATLASWGMHRMGKGGPKMLPFDTFRRSIEPLTSRIAEAQSFDLRAMDDAKWALVREVFIGISIMASGTRLVGHSKVMHHMMPNVVPPIDREYTLRHLRGNTNIKNNPDLEWQTLREIVSGFFAPVAFDPVFQAKASEWVANQEHYPWDTSVLKVVDNLVIGWKK